MSLLNAVPRRDDGGIVGGIAGITPTAQAQNPLVRGIIQRYAGMPVEKLQEYASQFGGSPQGQIIRQILHQKLAMPNTMGDQSPQMQQQIQPQPQAMPVSQPQGSMPQSQMPQGQAPMGPMPGERRGGTVPGREMGGPAGISMGMASPWWERSEARMGDAGARGFLSGTTMGRADAIKTTAPAGAYVLPADVVSGLGDGNSDAGAHVMDAVLRSGPHGIPQERITRGRGPPPAPRETAAMLGVAKGGSVRSALPDQQTPVRLSHGEYVVPVESVLRIGGGDLKRGHRILDKWVVQMRQRQIKKLRSLPGPVKSR